MFDLTGQVALVTGAQQGMGKADAIALAGQGATVVVTDIDQKKCDAIVKEIEAKGGKAVAFVMDVMDEKNINDVFDAVIKKFGKLDILVNNAGIYQPMPALEMPVAHFDKTIAVNLRGQFLCAQRAAKEMARAKYGRIVNIASIACGQVGVGVPGAVHYSASKGGIVGMSEVMAIEWAPLGITVNVIGPGGIDTPMARGGKEPDGKEISLPRAPIGRMGRPEEIAAAVVFLASKEASYVTGATLFVDGGYLSM
jgi:NAD(P)-dependent dehydrogenase (short-subunit alcohol dehydrogenase family)